MIQSRLPKWKQQLITYTVTANARAEIYESLADFMADEIRQDEAITELIESRISSRTEHDTYVWLLQDVLHSTKREGRSLAEALRPYVSTMEYMLIGAGDDAARKVKVLHMLAKILRDLSKAKRMFLQALVQPMGIFVLILGALYYLGYAIIPEIARMVPTENVTGWAGLLISMSEALASPWAMAVPFVILIFIGLTLWSLPNWTGTLRIWADKLPPWSFYRILNGGTWLVSLSSLMSAGRLQHKVLEEMAEVANPWLLERINYLIVDGRKGRSIGESLADAGLECPFRRLFGLKAVNRYWFPDRKTVEKLKLYSRLSVGQKKMEQIGETMMDLSLKKMEAETKRLSAISLGIAFVLLCIMTLGVFEIYALIQSSAKPY